MASSTVKIKVIFPPKYTDAVNKAIENVRPKIEKMIDQEIKRLMSEITVEIVRNQRVP